jgi:hypothetical protein
MYVLVIVALPVSLPLLSSALTFGIFDATNKGFLGASPTFLACMPKENLGIVMGTAEGGWAQFNRSGGVTGLFGGPGTLHVAKVS